MKARLPPAGEKTTVNRGQASIPKQQLRSGFPADRGHSQKGVDGTVVTIATPSVGVLRKPRYGCVVTNMLHGMLVAMRRMLTILSKGTSISILPIQKRKLPSEVTSTDLTRLYQNHASNARFAIETATVVACAPMGAATIISRMNIDSNSMN